MILRGPSHSVKNNIFTDNNSDYGAPFIFERDNYHNNPTTNSLESFMSFENNYFARNTAAVGGHFD